MTLRELHDRLEDRLMPIFDLFGLALTFLMMLFLIAAFCFIVLLAFGVI